MDRNKKLSVAGNALIAVTVAIAIFFMMTGTSDEGRLTLGGLSAFKYFTIESNAFVMLAAILFSARENRSDSGEPPKWLYIVKLAATGSVALTMLVTVVFLGPNSTQGYFAMFSGPNLYFHLLVPLVSIAVFILFEKTRSLRFADSLWGLLPTALYAAGYAVNVFSHAENGSVSEKYDWYGFVRQGTDKAIIPVAAMLGASLVISTLLWLGNRAGAPDRGQDGKAGETEADG